MDIRVLKYFVAIADSKGVTAAAKKLNISQPPLSKELNQLEDELGCTLFVRKRGNFSLTEEGERLYRYAEELIKLHDAMELDFEDMKRGFSGKLLLGTGTAAAVQMLPEVLNSLIKSNPKFRIELFEHNSDILLEMLDNNSIDIALIRGPFNEDQYEHISIDLLMNETSASPYYAAAHKDILKNGDEKISFDELIKYPLILNNRQISDILSHCYSRGLEPNVLSTNANLLTSLVWCSKKLGVAIVTSSVINMAEGFFDDSELVFKEIEEYKAADTGTSLVWIKDKRLNPIEKQFIKEIRNMLKARND